MWFPHTLFGAALTMAPTEKADVVVVGAGLSGLAAARRLIEGSCGTDLKVIVLEGRDRVGGRAWTAHMGEGKNHVDIGGAWLQYPDRNPLAVYLPEVEQHYTPLESSLLYDALGEKATVLDSSEMEEANAICEKLLKDAAAKEADAPATATALDMLPILDEGTIESNPSKIERVAAIYLRMAIENYLASSVEQVTGFGLADLSHVPPQTILKEGFEVAVKNLAKGLDVRLKNVVTKIEVLGEGKGVQVSTEDGKVVLAQKAVVTLPLGVLKANKVAFVPPLPEAKQRAIRRIGFGVLNKVVLRFPKVFWPKDKTFLLCATPDRSLVSIFLNLAANVGEPILVGFHQGLASLENEKCTDAELAEKAMVCLRKMYGADIPSPDEVVCTRWGTDPFSLGSYTAPHVLDDNAADTEDFEALAEPIGKNLYFCGETASKQQGLLHGAFNSGVRAAEEIIRDGLEL